MAINRSGSSPRPSRASRSPVTLELLTKARELGDTVEAFYAGGDADAVAAELGKYGADQGVRHRRPRRLAAGRAGGGGHRRADRGGQRARR